MKRAAILAMISGGVWAICERYVAEQAGAMVLGMPESPSSSAGFPPLAVNAATGGGTGGGGSGLLSRYGSVGVIGIRGVLGKGEFADTTYQGIRVAMAEAQADPDIKSILLRFDSPGGEAVPVETAAAEIFAARETMSAAGGVAASGKPIVALADGLMASAAYYLASQANVIYATPGAIVGSIGTRMDVLNLSGLLDRFGVKIETIKSTAAKDVGSFSRPMSEQDRAMLQAEIMQFDGQFVAAIMRGRGVPREKVSQWQAVRVYVGSQAQREGVVDGMVNSAEQLVRLMDAALPKVLGKTAKAELGGASVGSREPLAILPHSAGSPAEGNMGKAMLGIAGIAAGMTGILLDPRAGSAGGGDGGGGGGGSVLAAERATIEANARKIELDRVNAIHAAAIPFASNERVMKVRDEAVTKGWTVEQFNAAAIKHLAPAPLGRGPDETAEGHTTPVGRVGVGAEQHEKLGGAMALGIVTRYQPQIIQAVNPNADRGRAFKVAAALGFDSPDAAHKAIVSAQADGVAGYSMSMIAARCVATKLGCTVEQVWSKTGGDPLRLFGAAIETGRGGGILASGGGISSGDYPELFRNVANKSMIAAFELKPTIWQEICDVGVANDFKLAYMVGRSELGKFVKTPEGAPIMETKMAERRETIAVDKFTSGFALTFEAFVNDDVNAFLNLPVQLAETSAYVPQDLLWEQLKLNSYGGPTMQTDNTALFHANHKNLGTPAALSHDSVRAMRTAARDQRSRGSNPQELAVDLTVLLVPTGLSAVAEDIAMQDYVPGTAGAQNQKNTLKGVVKPVWSADLGVSTRYWMFTSPGRNSSFEVRFLRGQRTPTVAMSHQSDLTAMRYDAMLPGVGVAARSWEGAASNAGT